MFISIPGNYSLLFTNFYIARDPRPFITQVYIPAFLLIIISWTPLWLADSDAMIPENRVLFALTNILTITFLARQVAVHILDTYKLSLFSPKQQLQRHLPLHHLLEAYRLLLPVLLHHDFQHLNRVLGGGVIDGTCCETESSPQPR